MFRHRWQATSLLDAFAGRVGGETKPAATARDPKHRFGPGLRSWPSGRRGWAYRTWARARNPEVPKAQIASLSTTMHKKVPKYVHDLMPTYLVSSCAEHQTRQSSTPRSRYCELVQNSEVKSMRIIRYRQASIAIPMAVIIIKVQFDEDNLTSKNVGCCTVDRSRIQKSLLRA